MTKDNWKFVHQSGLLLLGLLITGGLTSFVFAGTDTPGSELRETVLTSAVQDSHSDSHGGETGDHGDSEGGHTGEETAHSDGEGHGGEHGGGLSSTAIQAIILQFIGFALLLAVFLIWVEPLIKNAHTSRKEQIEQEFQDLEERRQSLQKQEEEVNQKMTNIEEEARERREEILEKGRRMKEETIQEAKTQAENVIQQAKEEAQRERKRARIELEREMMRNAYQVIETYFSREASETLHDQMTNEFFSDLQDASSLQQFRRGYKQASSGNGTVSDTSKQES